MILSNVELHKALDSGRLVITPEPQPRMQNPSDPEQYCPYDTHAVDLTLGNEIVVPEPGTYAYDLTQPAKLSAFIAKNSRKRKIDKETIFVLERGQFVLAVC